MEYLPLSATLSIYKIQSVNQYSILDISKTESGEFHLAYFFGENEQRITKSEFLTLMSGGKITCVKRYCQSLTGWFPSGVLSVFTWVFAAQTVRHEFAILHTHNYVVLIELTGENSSCKKGAITAFRILKAKTKKEKEAAEKHFCKDRWYKRCMAVLEGRGLASLGMDQVWSIAALWILAARAGEQKYTMIQKNCKSLARTIFYFCAAQINYNEVLSSIWGIFTDKPGIVGIHPSIFAEDMILYGSRGFKSVRELREMTIDHIKKLRKQSFNLVSR